MPSPTAPRPVLPIASLPYEILLEIFVHCLPHDPFQPSTTTAPILLCHICSSWRQLAQASATLWTQLSYTFSVLAIEHPSSGPGLWEYKFRERDIAFVRWWKGKQGGILPVLAFKVGYVADRGITQKPPTSNTAFLLDYLTSAQHLDLDIFFWNWIRDKVLAGHPAVFPHLHTALAEHEHTTNGNHPFYQLQTRAPAPSLPTLRRLSLTEATFLNSNFVVPTQWATLTHLSLRASVSLLSWRTLIRAVPCLRWGHFDLGLTLNSPPFDTPYASPPPPQCILIALTSLSIVVRSTLARSAVFPFSLLFAGLHLPAVHSLALSAPGARIWEDHHALRELYTVLASVPAITELALEDLLDNVALSTTSTFLEMPPTALPILPDVDPIWKHAPALASLHIALPARLALRIPARDRFLALFVHHIFAAECAWLDLRNPVCPVRVVTISNPMPFFHRMGGGEMERVREGAKGAPQVALALHEGLVEPAAVDVGKEWGARG